MHTRGTEIAALEAKRNEEQVRSEGSLLGERRVAIARLVMMVIFGAVTQSHSGPVHYSQLGVGAAYTLYSIATLLIVFRLKANHSRALAAGFVLTVIDYLATTTLALISVHYDGTMWAGRHAISNAILITFAVARVSVWHVVLAVVLAETSYVIVASDMDALASRTSMFIGGGYVVIGVLIALTNRAVGSMFRELRARDNLTRFLPRQVADRVIAQGPDALAPVEREITVLFSDIRGFTTMSEGKGPRDVLVFLDDYFGRMSQIVKGHDGVVGKFLGDGLLAFWGVPDRLDDHAARAVKAARDMRRAVRELNQHREKHGEAPIKIGIGIHTGPVAAGMLGGQLQSEYTVIGDAVNVASRIEGLTKEHGVDVLVSETTWAQLGETVPTRKVGEGAIRGRKEPVVLYTLEGES